MAEPLLTALRPGPVASGAAVAAALARAAAPPEHEIPAPPWLWPAQRRALARVLAAVERHGGALLADPVGTGKTFVALAAARAWNATRPAVCLVPSSLVPQWQRAASRVGVEIVVASHERASRGILPPRGRGLVVVDESHRFRSPTTRRYRHVAPWLAGGPVLLLSATPLVNRLDDLAHQLRLFLRDDALAPEGLLSLARALRGSPTRAERLSALGLVVVTTADGRGVPLAARREVVVEEDRPLMWRLLEGADRLRLSRDRAIAALVRGVLWRAAASSPAALLGALRRYRRLLLQARDALAAGRAPNRAALRRFAAGDGDQLVLWALLPDAGDGSELDLGDLLTLDRLIEWAAELERLPDPKAASLRDLLADGRATLVFAGWLETVRYLRNRLGPGPVAWCTGTAAGVGRTIVPREAVLDLFRPGGRSASPARVLVSTDVSSEGLDLQLAERVVHYDLPWTSVRLDQRDGRAVRMGSAHRRVEVVRLIPPPPIERRLRLLELIGAKARLPASVGLGEDGRRLWRWRGDMAAAFEAVAPARGVAVGPTSGAGVLAGFEIAHRTKPAGERRSAVIGWMDADGRWLEDPEVLEAKLAEAAACTEPVEPRPEEIRAALRRLAPVVRERLRAASAERWRLRDPSPPARALVRQLAALARRAVRERDEAGLALLERAIRFAAGGHTAGEAMLVEELGALTGPALLARLRHLPAPTPPLEPGEPRLVGIVLFAAGARVAPP